MNNLETSATLGT